MPSNFLAYGNDRFEAFKKEKVRIFREKNGWFAKQEESSLNDNTLMTNFSICDGGTVMALDLLYNDNRDKISEIRDNSKN